MFFVPQMKTDRHKWMAFALQTIPKQTHGQFRVFPSPTDKILVKAVDGEYVVSEKSHITAFDAFQAGRDNWGKSRHPKDVMTVFNPVGKGIPDKLPDRICILMGKQRRQESFDQNPLALKKVSFFGQLVMVSNEMLSGHTISIKKN